DFEFMGEWWLPNDSANKIKGILTFSPRSGGSLKLNGPLENIQLENNRPKTEYHDIIHGRSWDGKSITLWKCSDMGSSFDIKVILEGWLFNRAEDIKFISVDIQYSYLEGWLDSHSGFRVSPAIRERGIDVSYRQPIAINTPINQDYSLEIQSLFKSQGLEAGTKHVEMQQELTVNIVSIGSIQERSFDEYMHMKNRFRDFLTLAISESVQTLSFDGKVRTQKNEQGKTVLTGTTVKIFYGTTNFVYPLEKISQRHILFKYSDISDRFADFISTWFGREQILEPVYDLYFGILHDPDMYLSNQFLSAIQAIETHHRRTRRNNELPPENHRMRYNALVRALPEEHRPWLEQKFASSNERTLRDRLVELVDDVFARITDLLLEDKTQFIKDLVR
ncbi:MAG: HEPN domain-containing protein, partial [Nitrososphaera sp.]